MPTPRTFEKVLTDLIRQNLSKNMVKKFQFFKTPFWGTSKNQRQDLKVCAHPSWLLVFKNGLIKHSSLTLIRASAGICICPHCTVLYCTLIVFPPNTNPLTTTKYQGPQTCISSSDLYFLLIPVFPPQTCISKYEVCSPPY